MVKFDMVKVDLVIVVMASWVLGRDGDASIWFWIMSSQNFASLYNVS